MVDILTNFRDAVFKKLVSGDMYFISSDRTTCKLGEVARVGKNFHPVKYNGDTVTVYDNSFGDVTYYEDSFESNSHEFVVVSSEFDSYYLYCLLASIDFESQMTGSSFKMLYKETLESVEVVMPSLEEQKMIGDYMKVLDKKIQLERKLV